MLSISVSQGIKVLGDCEYVAIFDADFKPEPDFLLRTVPYLVGNSEIGYVQTRWTFTNPEESYLTKVPTRLPPASRSIHASAAVLAALPPRQQVLCRHVRLRHDIGRALGNNAWQAQLCCTASACISPAALLAR